MTDWIADLEALAADCEPCALLTVVAVRGSAPREVGAKMIVTSKEAIGTIGGGQLEYQCSRIACEQMSKHEMARGVRRFALGTGCGQCCGGVVDVMFEYLQASGEDWLHEVIALYRERQPFVIASTPEGKEIVTADGSSGSCPNGIVAEAQSLLDSAGPANFSNGVFMDPVRPSSFNVAIFGAGHVGAATVDVLARLGCQIRWIDSRRDIFPASSPANVNVIESADPALEVAAMQKGSYFLVMTHSHPLDLEICDQVLRRDDAAYCGLIGSTSKRRRFERLMKKQGMPEVLLENLVCPIGVSGISGKKPAEIAVAVAAEILQTRDSMSAAEADPVRLKVLG